MVRRFKLRQVLDPVITVAVAGFSYWLAYALRFDFDLPDKEIQRLTLTIPLVLLSKFILSSVFSLHQRSWRYFSLVDAFDTVKAASLGSALFAIVMLLWSDERVPRSVFLMDWFVFPTLLIGTRTVTRLLFERGLNRRGKRWLRAAIVGAGDAGQAFVKELFTRANHAIEPVLILDDNRNKQGLRVHGVPVVGAIADLDRIAKSEHLDEVIIACHTLTPEKTAEIYQMCRDLDLPLKRIPRFEDILDGKMSPFALHNVEVEDLLPRSGVRMESDQLAQFFRGKTILVTGGGGSIGSEIVRQLCSWSPKLVVCFERNEFNLYEIDRELRDTASGSKIASVIGDICDGARVDHILTQYRPEIVFHAAAYKHVPLMECNAGEAVKNNVLGTEVVASLAMKHGVDRFILISTDKAVEPFNVMGYTKRAAELVLEEKFGSSKTKYMAVRFGNVLDSAGSVIPLFRRQIARGGPVTVTHPEIERYFMTIPEAVQLVLKAGELGKGGEIFVLDMGKPVRIVELARKMIELSGMHHVQIKFIGLRPGEKLSEILVNARERANPTEHSKISAIYPARRTDAVISGWIAGLVHEIDDLSDHDVLSALREIVSCAEDRSAGPPKGMDRVVSLPNRA